MYVLRFTRLRLADPCNAYQNYHEPKSSPFISYRGRMASAMSMLNTAKFLQGEKSQDESECVCARARAQALQQRGVLQSPRVVTKAQYTNHEPCSTILSSQAAMHLAGEGRRQQD